MRDVFENTMVEAQAKAKAKARLFRIKATYAYESYTICEAP